MTKDFKKEVEESGLVDTKEKLSLGIKVLLGSIVAVSVIAGVYVALILGR